MRDVSSVEILKRLVSYPSVTPLECGIYEYIATLLPQFRRFEIEKNGVKNVLFYYIPPKFLESNLQNSMDITNVTSKRNALNNEVLESKNIESSLQNSKQKDSKNTESKSQDSMKTDSKNTQDSILSPTHHPILEKDSKNLNAAYRPNNKEDSKENAHRPTLEKDSNDFSENELKAFRTLKHFCFAGHIDVVAPGGDYICKDSKFVKIESKDSKKTQENIESKVQDSMDITNVTSKRNALNNEILESKNIESNLQDFTKTDSKNTESNSQDSKKDSKNNLSPTHHPILEKDSKNLNATHHPTNEKEDSISVWKYPPFSPTIEMQENIESSLQDSMDITNVTSKRNTINSEILESKNIESSLQDSKQKDSKNTESQSQDSIKTDSKNLSPTHHPTHNKDFKNLNAAYRPIFNKEENKKLFLYGRGSQDMKGGIACFLQAIINNLDSIKKGEKIISILLTSDEEGDGIYGTRYMLEVLKEKNLLPHYAIVAEPTSEKKSGDTIKVGRRGSINGKITIKGKQGHVAYPEKCVNPLELLGAKLGKLAGVNLDSGDANFAPSKLVITDIRGGIEAVNVTPAELKIMFNVRNSTLSDVDSVKGYIESVLKGVPHELSLKQTSKSFVAKKDSKLVKLLEKSVVETQGFKPTLSTSGGTSDARFFSEYGVEVAEVGVCNDRIHAVNERVALSDIESLRQIFECVINSLEML